MHERDRWLVMSDAELLAQCHEDFYRASGPGGQKRNKTESAVRLRHPQTGIMVTATESRLRQENRDRALRRMREALALRVRQRREDATAALLLTFIHDGEISIRKKDPAFLTVAAQVLDLLDHHQGRLSDTAGDLQTSTAQLVKFLKGTTELWESAQQIRSRHGQSPLRSS